MWAVDAMWNALGDLVTATTEAPAFKDRKVLVVGGGNSAGQAAIHLARFAKDVQIVIRRQSLQDSMSRSAYGVKSFKSSEAIFSAAENMTSRWSMRDFLNDNIDYKENYSVARKYWLTQRTYPKSFSIFSLVRLQKSKTDKTPWLSTGHELTVA